MLIRIFAVLAVAALIACGFLGWRSSANAARADAAEQRAEALQGELQQARQARQRDDTAAMETDKARASADQRQAEREVRRETVEAIAHEPRDPVPAVCPGGDARIVQDSAAATRRVLAAEDRLRGLRRAEGGKAGTTGTD